MSPTSPPVLPARRRRRVIFIILAILALPVLVGLGWYINFRVSNTRAIARLEAKAQQRGEPLTLAALAATYPPIDDAENAAVPLLALWQQEEPAFWQAFLAGQRPLPEKIPPKLDPNLPILNSKSRPVTRTNALPPAALAAAESYLKEHAAHMDALRVALQRPRFRFPIQITDGFSALLPHLTVMRTEAQHFRLEALVASERGDADAAINALTNTARVGQLLADEPVMISQLVRLACLTMSLDGAQSLLSRRELDSPQLARLELLFHSLQLTGVVRRVMVNERASGLSVFNLSPRDVSATFNTGEADSDGVTPGDYALGMKVLRAIGLTGADQRLMLEVYDEAIELTEQDSPEALRRFGALFDEVDIKARRFPPRIFTSLLLPALHKVANRYANFEARRRAALTALAVERFRRAHSGALPDRLDDLVPQFLPALPFDPNDGQPLRYRRRSPGYVIYSIGSDGVDHGGKERPLRGSARDVDETFTVDR